MGQKVNPISNRLGIIRGWDSNWYAGKKYGENLLEDSKIREYLNERLSKAGVSKIVIERTIKRITITVCTPRPGIIIGKGGQEVDKLKEELRKITDKDVQINIHEVKRPELDAHIVASTIARQIEGKTAYRRAAKMAIASTMRMGAQGIKVLISGRLNGAEMARSEMLKEGLRLSTLSVPTSTTLSCPRSLRWASSVSRFGYAAAKSTASPTSPPTLPLPRVKAARAVSAKAVSARKITIVEPF
jgi:small subunit ribosomal protein S3